MSMTVDKYLSQVNTQKNARSTLRRLGSALSVLVILGVFWGLKLTGITMAGDAFCGMEEHVHSETCVMQELICALEETPAHVHSDECLEQILICPEEEAEAHTHSEECSQKTLVCTLSDEASPHSHGDECYIEVPACGMEEKKVRTVEYTLGCGLEETKGHTHDDDCYTLTAVCGEEESEDHQHSEECMENILTCERSESEGHSHSDACYVAAASEEEEGHVHDDSCMESQLVCDLQEEEVHTHTDACYLETKCCELEETEGHTHTDACYEVGTEYACGVEETEGHTHGEECYSSEENECPIEEHIHVPSCYSDTSADLETSDNWEDSMMDLEPSVIPAENVVLVAESQLNMAESLRNFEVDEAGIRRGITRYGQWYGNPYGDWSAMFACFCLEYAGIEEIPTNAGPETMRLSWEEEGLYAAAAEGEPLMGFLLFLDKNDDGKADSVAVITDYNEDEQIIFAIEGDLSMQVTQIRDVALPEDEETEEVSEEAEEETTPEASAEEETTDEETEAEEEEPYEVPEGYTVNFFDVDRVARTLYELDDPAIMGYGEVPFMPDAEVYAPGDRIIWLDGTNGGLQSLLGASNEKIVLDNSETSFTLPGNDDLYRPSMGGVPPQDAFNAPTQYAYELRGWYDVTTGNYYKPGVTVEVPVGSANRVFYADWVPMTYDIGQPNEKVADTVSTSDFVKIRMFDYNELFNLMSVNLNNNSQYRVLNENSHREMWTLVTSGSTFYNTQNRKPTAENTNTLNFVFRDWDYKYLNQNNQQAAGAITYPENINDKNTYLSDTNGRSYPGTLVGNTYTSGTYTDRLKDLLFGTDNSYDPDSGDGVIGKLYLGEADHLFQFGTDPNDEDTYGYYYYDSELNAASYNQSNQRFYVYNYLEKTSASGTDAEEGDDQQAGTAGSTGGKFSDFLPLNSPYVNTNGKPPAEYSYVGENNEYVGTTHYQYEATNGTKSVRAEFLCGMYMEVDFYLPNTPGQGNGNLDIHGNQMHFKFDGDDDVWVFVDDKMVLDLGGVHAIDSGDINFSTGTVTNSNNTALSEHFSRVVKSIGAGEHTLKIYYLERGSSQSNCAIYFNLAPRFSFSIEKEDTLTKDALNGAEFSVYTDAACKTPAQLWPDKESHDLRKDATVTNTFTVVNGKATMWGLVAGQTYYIKETKAPDNPDYNKDDRVMNGIIKVSLNNMGNASYNVEMLPGANNSVSGGFTVHGYRIDEETQEAYIIATNSPWWVNETTSVHARKVWADDADHSGDSVTVYLTVKITDTETGKTEIRRLQEATLSEANDWKYQWDNLPKYWEQSNQVEVEYGIEEAYIEGYVGKVTSNDKTETVTTSSWEKVTTFADDGVYLLGVTRNGVTQYMATPSSTSNDTGFVWMTESAAKSSPAAQWTADVETTGQGNNSVTTVKLTNGDGRTLTCWDYGNGVSDFFTYQGGEDSNRKQKFRFTFTGNTVKLYYQDGSSFYLSPNAPADGDATKLDDTNANDAMVITPLRKTTTTTTVTVPTGIPAFKVTNTPLEPDQKTTVTVNKQWNYGSLTDSNLHASARVTMKLLANGKDTGRTVTLTAPNWTATFTGLPAVENGVYINYTVKEVEIRGVDPDDWIPSYGPVTSSGDNPTYSTTVTNTYFDGVSGPELPSTGTAARLMYILCGSGIMLTSLVYGIIIRYKRERRKTVAP